MANFNPYLAMLGLDPNFVGEANRGLQSGVGYDGGSDPWLGAVGQPRPPMFQRPLGAGGNPILQALIQRNAAAHYPQMPMAQPARKSGNSLGVNVAAAINGTTGYTPATFPAAGVQVSATTTLQSEFHGLKLSASVNYQGTYTPSGGATVNAYGQQTNGSGTDVVLLGVFVGGFNAQPLAPGSTIADGGVSLSAFPNNGLGNGIDMLPGKIGQQVRLSFLILPTLFSAFTIAAGAVLTVVTVNILCTFFGDNLQ